MFEVVYSGRPAFSLQSEVLFVSVETVHTLPAFVDSHCSGPEVRHCQKQRQSAVLFMSPVVRGLICFICVSLSVCLSIYCKENINVRVGSWLSHRRACYVSMKPKFTSPGTYGKNRLLGGSVTIALGVEGQRQEDL